MCWNLSLSNHLSGLDAACDCVSSQAALERALTLYDLTHKLLLHQRQQVPAYAAAESSSKGGIAFLLLSIANNIGQIRMKLSQTKEAIECFQRLLNSLLIIRECGGGTGEDIWEDSHQSSVLQGFFRNSLHLLVLKVPCTARAA